MKDKKLQTAIVQWWLWLTIRKESHAFSENQPEWVLSNTQERCR